MTYPVFANGDALPASDMNAIGLWLVKTQTIGTGVSSVSLSSVYTDNFENYKIVVSGIALSVAANTVNYRNRLISTDATTNYNWGMARIDLAASTVAASSGALTDRIAIGVGTGDKFGASFDVLMPKIATHTIIPFISGINISTGYAYSGAAMHQTSTAYDGFTIFPNSGTMTGGIIRVYGYRN